MQHSLGLVRPGILIGLSEELISPYPLTKGKEGTRKKRKKNETSEEREGYKEKKKREIHLTSMARSSGYFLIRNLVTTIVRDDNSGRERVS